MCKAEALFQGEDLDIKLNKYGHEVNDYSVQCSLLINCAEFLIFLLNFLGVKNLVHELIIMVMVHLVAWEADQEESFCCSVGNGKV